MLRSIICVELSKVSAGEDKFSVEIPENPEHGDYATNVALILARKMGKNPREFAEELALQLRSGRLSGFCEKIEVAGPGFLNFSIKKEFLQKSLPEALKKDFGRIGADKKKKINIEFVPANPTGPLTMANGRGGFYGDALANILETAGHKVTREYYVNDAGNQIKLLEESIRAAEGKIPKREEHYKGEYINKLKGKSANLAIAEILKWIRASLKRAGIKFDVWFFEEKELRKKGELQKTLSLLEKKGLVERRDGAIWLGDAVLVKSGGEPTYFLSDLAYHYDKFFKRKFELAVNIWGADHHGYVARVEKGIEALGIEPSRLRVIVMQLVRLLSKGKEARMSKRAGEFVTLDDLLKLVGVDAARWFFLEKSPDTHMDFDLDLAKERSKKNPVYYAQYAHARASSILKKARKKLRNYETEKLNEKEELALIKKILKLPEVVEDIAGDYQVHRLTKYTYELAKSFTDFYENCRVIYPERSRGVEEDKKLTIARLTLVLAAQKTLEKILKLMGIAAPKKM